MGDWQLLVEDPALLDATLSLLESLDGSSDSTSDATLGATQKPRAKRSKNLCRERRQQELHQLRSTASELETQLTTLQRRRESMLRAHFNRGGAVLSTAPIWENMVRRQVQARKLSEAVNAKLRARLEEQAKAARDLFDAIEVAVRRHEAVQPRKVRLPIDISLRMSEEQQLERLHANHTKWQWALSLSPRLQQGELQFTEFQVTENDGLAATLELHCSHVFPYPLSTVTELMWSIFLDETVNGEDDEDNMYMQQHRSVDDLIIAMFSSTSTMGGGLERGGKMEGKWVAKQERAKDGRQHFLTSHWHYELTGFGNELDGVSADEETWLRFVSARDIGHTHLSESLTVMQQVRRLRLQLSDHEPVELPHVERVTSLFKSQIEGELDWMERVMDSSLLAPPVSKSPVSDDS